MKDVVYEKTDLGWAEINSRTRKFSGQLRTLLVVIDGQRPVAELLTTLGPLGVSDDSFRQLKEAGLIEPVAHSASVSLSGGVPTITAATTGFLAEELTELIGEAIDRNFGLSRATYHQRLSATSTREDFLQLAMDIVDSLKISRGNGVASEFWESVEPHL